MADLLVRAGALQSDECGADGKAAGGLTVYFKYCSGEKIAAEDFSPDATCADMYKAARSIVSNTAEMTFGGVPIPEDSTPIADVGISQECCIHLDAQLTYLGLAAWYQKGSSQTQDEQDSLMNRVCEEQFGEGARAATFVEYSGRLIAGVPTCCREAGAVVSGFCCFTGPEGIGSGSLPNPKKCTDHGAALDGTCRYDNASSGDRLCIAVR
eukprot:TRINITY_DN1189_c0_g1_i5.p1 TRINITY_DN1189_c0_g1~~TRINITY_DN1189_c0_g1_i5.p1  ORF type:complete len:211 (+),score=24.19 TRINITY_DN1189_c0_g1_i5:59-691(+)